MPEDALDKFEKDSMYWIMYMKYKQKLRFKRFLKEFEFITRKWFGNFKAGDFNNYLDMFYMFITKEGIIKGRGTGKRGTFTIEGSLLPKKRTNIKLTNEENVN